MSEVQQLDPTSIGSPPLLRAGVPIVVPFRPSSFRSDAGVIAQSWTWCREIMSA